ncbi:MAG: ribulose-phosphate 3-epimerase [Brevinematia bacterium]
MRKVKISPSIFAADFLRLGEIIKLLEDVQVDYIHYDVMDNHFVPNISFGPLVIETISSNTKIPGDVHLMIDLSKEKLKRFFLKNVEFITLHLEAEGFSKDLLNLIKKQGYKPGISIKPNTPSHYIEDYLDIVDLILVMTVEPGFSGQKIIHSAIDKISEVKKLVLSFGRDIPIEVDGGVNTDNIRLVVDKGADIIVMGSFFFKDDNFKKVIDVVSKL